MASASATLARRAARPSRGTSSGLPTPRATNRRPRRGGRPPCVAIARASAAQASCAPAWASADAALPRPPQQRGLPRAPRTNCLRRPPSERHRQRQPPPRAPRRAPRRARTAMARSSAPASPPAAASTLPASFVTRPLAVELGCPAPGFDRTCAITHRPSPEPSANPGRRRSAHDRAVRTSARRSEARRPAQARRLFASSP
mmetsp:Transcript_133227/g.385536  ORF Transcript_133227/g.385536 Transcript_133227/m.385536 type:complete len:201 (+) Transcript_133227:565-1167(+)